MQCAAQNEDSAPEALGLKFTPLGTGDLPLIFSSTRS